MALRSKLALSLLAVSMLSGCATVNGVWDDAKGIFKRVTGQSKDKTEEAPKEKTS
jgi:predicted small secreted protein